MRFTFPKPEHLCLQADIEELFSAGSTSMTVYPLRVTFRTVAYSGHGPKVKVLLSVSKRRLRHAVSRNRAKRQLREAYRLQKNIVISSVAPDTAVNMAFIWLADHDVKSRTVASRMNSLLHRIGEQLKANAL